MNDAFHFVPAKVDDPDLYHSAREEYARILREVRRVAAGPNRAEDEAQSSDVTVRSPDGSITRIIPNPTRAQRPPPPPEPAEPAPAPLTEAQNEAMALLADGMSRPGMARVLGIQKISVDKRLEGAFRKLGVKTRREAVHQWRQRRRLETTRS